jgi:glycerophosphoryl diester phosphodiesterase
MMTIMITIQYRALYCFVFLLFLAAHSKDSNQNNKSVLVIAHRGSTGENIPENTMASFRACIEIGINLIEIDLRGSRDGHIMIMHDENLERTTNGTGKLSAYTFSELKELDAGNGEMIPTYKDVLELIRNTGVKLLLDIKLSETLSIGNVVSLTERNQSTLDVIAGVRELDDLKQIKQINPNIRTLGFISNPDLLDDFINAGIDIIRLWPKWIQNDPAMVKKIHDLGKPVWSTCTSSKIEDHKFLIDAGVNGIITDYPDMLKDLLKNIN